MTDYEDTQDLPDLACQDCSAPPEGDGACDCDDVAAEVAS